MYLLIYPGNWNDEISVDGFIIIDDQTKKKIVKLLKHYNDNIYISNGDSDDDTEYENGNELLDEITFDKIDDNEIPVIDKFFGKFNDFGYNFLLNIDKLSDNVNIL